MNRFLRGRRATPWAWMQTGPLTVDAERLAAVAAEQIPAVVQPERANVTTENPCHETNIVESAESQLPQRQGTVSTVPQDVEHSGVSTPEVSPRAVPSEETEPALDNSEITLDELPALKAAMESLEKRGDPILASDDTQPAAEEPLQRPRPKARSAKRRRIVKRVNLRPAAPRKQSLSKTQSEIDVSHHQRRCTICRHPEREAIEEAFIQWRNVESITWEFKPAGGRTAIYRHAHALNLFKRLNLALRSSLEFVIEQSERVVPTAEGLVKAIRAYTRINDSGEWIDTPTTHIVQVVAMPTPDAGNHPNPIPGLTLNVRKNRSDIIESPAHQSLLTGTAPQTEITVTD